MKNKVVIFITAFILFSGFCMHCFAMSETQSEAIQSFLNEACRKSGAPGMSVSILYEGEAHFFSSGYADREKKLSASEDTLYELASVSKAFTGVGILLLEEQGLLSMNDSIDKYLPWLTLRYQDNPIDMSKVTLNNFLHHSSGLTNGKHFVNIPEGNTPDMLQKTIESLVDTELAFFPGERYEYGSINYDVLGLVIEVVSGQRYEDFMQEQVFEPLGLRNTYLYADQARSTGQMAQGYRTSFFLTTPYNAPDYGGNKAAGYVITSARDMARWMGIQMGMVKDIPEIFRTVIAKSHKGDTLVQAGNGFSYAAGWYVNADRTFINHAGGNPAFSTNVCLFPKEQTAICFLSNNANTNVVELVKNIKDILDGNLTQSYKISNNQLQDINFSVATIIIFLLSVMFFIWGLYGKKASKHKPLTKKKIIVTIVWLTITVAICVMCWIFPVFAGINWSYLFVWQTYSILTACISLFLLSASITWFVFARRR